MIGAVEIGVLGTNNLYYYLSSFDEGSRIEDISEIFLDEKLSFSFYLIEDSLALHIFLFLAESDKEGSIYRYCLNYVESFKDTFLNRSSCYG